jgi:hypothetical protein
MAKPLLIHTYRPTCTSIAQPRGFGDFLRGTIALHQAARRFDFDLQVDFSSHPLANFILPMDPPPPFPDAEVHEYFTDVLPKLLPFVAGLAPDTVTLITTNGFPNHDIDVSTQEFVRQRIAPTAAVAGELSALRAHLGLSEFCSVHLRLGDHRFGDDNPRLPELEEFLRDQLVPEWGKRILVFSDNYAIKQQLSEMFGLPLVRNVPVHLGQLAGSGDSPHDRVRDTYLDFLLLACSERIYQHSAYYWGSGFSSQCAQVYGIPLSRIGSR